MNIRNAFIAILIFLIAFYLGHSSWRLGNYRSFGWVADRVIQSEVDKHSLEQCLNREDTLLKHFGITTKQEYEIIDKESSL